ncbi:MAG: aldo/keto reductase [Firmicutes bacterium]|nr:aldo/keto reductase [Bacillota bacterium]
MQYQDFGNTGVKVSRLGFGGMRLPVEDPDFAVTLLREGFRLGINYVDTALYYLDGQSEVLIGKALKGYRNKVYLSTKNPIEDSSGVNWRKRLETSLTKLDTDYIDFYHMWAINLDKYENLIDVKGGPMEEALKAKEEGLIRHISFSFHDTPENLIKLVDTGNFETMLVQYNLLDRSNEQAISYAKSKGLGVAIMGPVGGGRLGAPSEQIQKLIPKGTKSSAEMALRFVFSNPNVDVALSGMSDLKMLQENVRIASIVEPLSKEEKDTLEEILREKQRLANLYCTGCNYCMPCPNGVDIPKNFTAMNYFRVYDLLDTAKSTYEKLKNDQKAAESCIQCYQCESKCPQKIKIVEQLEEVASKLA